MNGCEITIENNRPVVKTYPRLMQDILVYTDSSIKQSLDLYGIVLTDEFKELGIKNPSLNNILGFIEQDYINSSGNLSRENKQIMLDLSLQSGTDLDIKENFLKTFEVDGKFGLNTDELSRSKIFSDLDIIDFENHIDSLKDLYYNLKNTEEDFDSLFNKYIIKTNSISKQNPDNFLQNIQDNYSGLNTEKEILDKATKIGDQIVLNNTSLIPMILEDVQDKQQLIQYETDEYSGELVKKSTNSIQTELEQTLNVDQDFSDFIPTLEYVMENPSTEYIGNIELYGKSLGINLNGLQDKSTEKTPEENVDFLNSLYNLVYDIESGNKDAQDSIKQYSESYDSYFGIEPDVVKKTVDKINKDGVYLHLETNKTEEEIFQKNGLLKIGDNIYQKIKNTDSLESLYEIIFNNKSLLPKSIYSVEVKDSNKDMILEDIDKHVSNLAKEYLTETSDPDTLKKMVVYKILTGTKYNPESKIYNGNMELDVNNFLINFNKFLLENQDIRGLFYFSNRGLEAKTLIGEYTAIQLENNLPLSIFQDLVTYSKLSGNDSLRELTSFNNIFEPEDLRDFYANNLEQLKHYKGEYYHDNGYVVTNSNEDFIRVKNQLYENVAPNVYGKVETNPRYTNYNLEKPNYDDSVEPDIKGQEKGKISVRKIKEINNDEIEFC